MIKKTIILSLMFMLLVLLGYGLYLNKTKRNIYVGKIIKEDMLPQPATEAHQNQWTQMASQAVNAYEKGDYPKGIEYAQKAYQYALMYFGQEHRDTLASLKNLALGYTFQNRFDKAEVYLKRYLQWSRKILGPQHRDTLTAMDGLAQVYHSQGRYDEAEELFKKCLRLKEKTLGKGDCQTYETIIRLAYLYLKQNRLDEAYYLLKFEGLDMASSPGIMSIAFGRYYLAKHDWRSAEILFKKELAKSKMQEIPPLELLICAHIGLGFALEGQKNYADAKKNFQSAVDLLENQWQTLSPSDRKDFTTGRTAHGFRRLDPYEGLIRILLLERKKKSNPRALEYVEIIKSRLFIEELSAAKGLSIRPEDRQLMDKNNKLQHRLAGLYRKIELLQNQKNAATKEKEQLLVKFRQASTSYENFLGNVRLSGDEIGSLITVKKVLAKDLQNLLPADTTLIEYFLAKGSSYAWLVTSDQIKVYHIKADEKLITDMVNELRRIQISINAGQSDASTDTAPPQKLILNSTENLRRNRNSYNYLSQKFYRLLIAPLVKDIKTTNLVIVPYGALFKLPFASLNDNGSYLVDQFAISILPDAAVMQSINRNRNKNHNKLLAFSNPKNNNISLPFAETELKAISGLFPQKDIYRYDKATEKAAKEKSQTADIIHLSCYGELNDESPLQSGFLLAKDSANDGKLQIPELFGLNLKEANLVALSACETGLKSIQGAGDMVGLSHGFIYAGAPALITTLWQVNHRALSTFMYKFYLNWQVKKMTKSQALRKAQLDLKKMPQFSHAYFWAPFMLIGDWR